MPSNHEELVFAISAIRGINVQLEFISLLNGSFELYECKSPVLFEAASTKKCKFVKTDNYSTFYHVVTDSIEFEPGQ